jgi:hypothetical protein
LLDAVGLGLSILASLGEIVLVRVHSLGQGIDPGYEVGDGQGRALCVLGGVGTSPLNSCIGTDLLHIVERSKNNGVRLITWYPAKRSIDKFHIGGGHAASASRVW